jgi:hypothetical protein
VSISLLIVVVALSLLLFVGLLFLSFLLFDQLLRVQIVEAPFEWETMGRPSGYFWKPVGSQPLTPRERGYIWSAWFQRKPLWASTSHSAARIYTRFKVIGWFAGIAFAPVLFFGAQIPVWLLATTLASLGLRP